MKLTSSGIAIAAAAAMLALAGCSDSDSGAEAEAPTDSTLTLGALTDAASWDPADAEFGHRIQYVQPVYDSLLKLTPELEIEPSLASSYEYNDDNTRLALELRDDVVFTDGEPFDAEAAKANLEHFKNGTGQNSITLAAVDSVEVLGDHEIALELSEPDPALLRNLALVAGMQASPAVLGDESLKTTPVGSGPYVLDADQTTTGSVYTYTRNTDYWDPDAYPFDEIEIKPLNDLSARLNALKAGEIDAALADAKSIEEAEASELTVHTEPGDWQGLFIVDREGTNVPALADPQVRQAINYAIDGQGILESIRLGQGEPTTQIFSPASQAYDPELDDAYGYDPERARDLLAGAGYADGFTVTMPEVSVFADLNPIVVQQLGDVGITVQSESVPIDQGISELLSGEFPMFAFSWGSSHAWQDLLKLVNPDAPWNMYGNEAGDLDALIGQAQEAGTAEAFQAVSAYLVDNAWFAPWYVQDNVYLSSPDVEVTMQPQNVVPYIANFAPAG